MRWIGLFIIFTAVLAGIAGAQDKRIVLKDGVVTFVGGKTIPIVYNVKPNPKGPPRPEGWWMAASVSANGQLAAILDLQASLITVHDHTGKTVRTIKISHRFRHLDISDKGLIVAREYVPETLMGLPRRNSVMVYDAKGKVAKSYDHMPMNCVKFLYGGKVAALISLEPKLFLVQETGEFWNKDLKFKYAGVNPRFDAGAVIMDPSKSCLVITTVATSRRESYSASQIFFYRTNPEGTRFIGQHSWVVRGGNLSGRSIALSPDGKYLVTIEPRRVRCFDLDTYRRKWIDIIGHPDTGTTKPQRIAGVYVSKHRVVTAHLVPTGKGWRVLYSVYTMDGKPVSKYNSKADPARGINSFLSDEIPRGREAGPFWTISKDGQNLVTLGKVKIPLIEEKK